ncbi:TetR/AcrR family transcriptional regulator [Natronogracilivirga saccharolytica]|uniref:TetR/AcrR family transcriptional regulator n=1 Tax=Natronogracilivirga saccharolytica TaxID=2812953 RepID=A0A8J7USZ7_9BACT|nr:TetR/AcrR family transcriptional regulator [Natronogracilivirga saccharolytica]MBP3192096.1 TetR/AcrR family transcriptional regulator [Natronogracilivirga saccharolytica]
MAQKDNNTEQQIKEAARRVFHREGLEGARMQAIADEANINKAMLHYYYRSKERLFQEVFEEDFITQLAPIIQITRDPSIHVEDMIKLFVQRYIDVMAANPQLPLFLMYEIARNPDRLLAITRKYAPLSESDDADHDDMRAMTMIRQIEEGQKEGRYNPVNPEHFSVSLIGMCVYPIIARNTLMQAFRLNEEEYRKFVEERKKEVVDHAFRILMKPEYYEQRMTDK